jgi:hypothetical protein
VEGTVDVDVEHAPPVLVREVDESAGARHTGVVDEDRDRAGALGQRLDRCANGVAIGHVRDEGGPPATCRLDHGDNGPGAIAVPIETSDGGPIRRQTERRRPSDPGRGAGDQRDLPVERAIRHPRSGRSARCECAC